MPVDEQQPQAQPAVEAEPPMAIGSRLSAARAQRDLTLENAASMLHVDVVVLKNLESENFESLGAAVYVRGHLRKYAAILGLPAEELLAAYQAVAGEEEVTPIVSEGMAMSRRRRGKGLWLLLSLLALALVLALVAWWWLVLRVDSPVAGVPLRQASPEQLAVQATVAQPDPVPTSPAGEASGGPPVTREEPLPRETRTGDAQPLAASELVTPEQDTPISSRPAATQVETAAATVQESQAPAPVAQEPAGELASLEFVFSEDSWVEVYDGAGQRVLYGLFNTGTRRQLSARGPFSVYLGYARGVSISLDGEPYEVPASMLRGNTARFNIDAGNY